MHVHQDLRRRSRHGAIRALVGLALLNPTGACARHPALAADGVPTRPTADHLFAFRSNPWVNLHHFLYQIGRARSGLDAGRAPTLMALADTSGAGALGAADGAAWEAAVQYYMRAVSQRDILFDSSMVRVTNALSDLPDGAPIAQAHLDSALTAALVAAMPVYRALWWPRHDRANRAWIDSTRRLLALRGDSAAAWEARALGTTWPPAPVRVDVSAYTNWAGAYTSDDPDRINMSSLYEENQGIGGFETLFHEVQHTMARPLLQALLTAAHAHGKRVQRDPTHVFIFFTAGQVTRALFPGYVPFGERTGFWKRTNEFGGMRPLLVRYWQPWLDGTGTMREALDEIAAAM
jgi:hypothetical protein